MVSSNGHDSLLDAEPDMRAKQLRDCWPWISHRFPGGHSSAYCEPAAVMANSPSGPAHQPHIQARCKSCHTFGYCSRAPRADDRVLWHGKEPSQGKRMDAEEMVRQVLLELSVLESRNITLRT